MKTSQIPESFLNAVRLRLLGTTDLTEDTVDKHIETLSYKELIEKWCGWFITEESWGTKILDYYEELIKADGNVIICKRCGGNVEYVQRHDATCGLDYDTLKCTKCGEEMYTNFEQRHRANNPKLNNIRTWAKGLQSLSDKNSTEYSIFEKLVKMIDE